MKNIPEDMTETKLENQSEKNQAYKAVCFHDGECPLCKIEISAMQKLDKQKHIKWVDISKQNDLLESAGISYQQAMDRIHVIDEKQQILTGVSGFLVVWKNLPYFRRVVPVLEKTPGLLGIMEYFYSLFARNRMRLTGRQK